jgi:Fe-S oxidoreductase
MCPSYKATGDPALSPKGRADLLRSWLNRRHTGDPGLARFEDALAENLHQCLSCSACSGRCPIEVDIPEMKSRFLEEYYRNRQRPRSHTILSRFEEVAAIAGGTGRIGGIAGRFERLVDLGAGPAGRILGLVDLPHPKRARQSHRTFSPAGDNRSSNKRSRGSGHRDNGNLDVVIMPDVFSASLDPDVLAETVTVLERIGLDVAVAPFTPSGKFDHVKGRRDAFVDAVRAQGAMVDAIVAAGADPVVIEPAVALLHRAEYQRMIPDHPGDQVKHLAEVLDHHRDRLPTAATALPVRLLSHCTERATAPDVVSAWTRVLTAVGHSVSVPELGCCGMAGIFGHEIENQTLSRALWDLTWADQVADTTGVPVATGYSCRSQADRFADRLPVRHPIHLLL